MDYILENNLGIRLSVLTRHHACNNLSCLIWLASEMEFTESEKKRENEEIKFSLLLSTPNTVRRFGCKNLSFV